MSENTEQLVDTNSPEFKQGVEAALNSKKDTKNWQAGNELGHELKNEDEKEEPEHANLFKGPSTPLFLRDDSGGNKGNAQDEKDGLEE